MFATKNGLPHRSCMASGVIRDVRGPTRHEMMILTGLTGVRMVQKAYLKHEVFPVSISTSSGYQHLTDVRQILMLSIYGSKARIVQAHMSPEQLRLQVRHSEFFDFRNLTKQWLEIFVRWFLNEPQAGPSLSLELDSSEQPGRSDDEVESLVPLPPKSQKYTSNAPRTSGRGDTPQEPLSRPMWNIRCDAEEASLEQSTARLPTIMDAH